MFNLNNRKTLGQILAILFIFFSAVSSHADTFTITGTVKNRATDSDLFDVKVRLLNASDSSEYAVDRARRTWYSNGMKSEEPVFQFYRVDREGKYILELSMEDYDTYYLDIDPSTISKRSDKMNLGNLYMRRSPKMLDELVVRPSKVYFYNKGDTLVYNADAFVLAEGSMLDDLLRQMPGVELKEGGQIYVNGRYVENLLLNGKDFFKGNNQMMLENLGAYTVKNIAVYEKQDDMDKIMGKDYGERKLSMDVRLKKDYSQGLMTNVEAGYGTNERYLGRLFALWYSDNARLTVYGNINNLSDNRKPGHDTGFTPAMMQAGDFKNAQGGLDYWAKIPYKDVTFFGDVVASHVTVNTNRSVYTTNFLPGGDTYGYSFTNSKNKKLSLTTTHNLDIQKQKWNMRVTPSVKYYKNNDLSGITSAVFDTEWQEIGKDFIDNLYTGASADVLRSILNRNLNDEKRLGHTTDVSLFSNGKLKIHNEADALTYLINGSYKKQSEDVFQKYRVNFRDNAESADYSDRYFDNSPNYKWTGSAAVGYIFGIIPGLFLDTWYQYEQFYTREVSELYRLENLYGSVTEEKPLGYLPSVSEYHSTLDPNNSFDSRERDEKHSLHFDLSYRNNEKNIGIMAKLPIMYRRRHLHYIRGAVNEKLNRDNFFIGDASIDFNWSPKIGWIYARFQRNLSYPDMVDMVNFTNSLDPLNVKSGNPGLKDAVTSLFQLNFTRTTWDYRIRQAYDISYTMMQHSLAYGYSYNSTTGVKTGKMYNVEGNFQTALLQSLYIYLGAEKNFMLRNSTALRFTRSVDLVGENNPEPQKRKVYSPSLKETLGVGYVFGNQQRLELFGTMGLSRFNSHSQNFTSFTAKDITCGLAGNFNLPLGFSISTDFNVYARRGYSDASLNKTNFVWNARVSYSMLKGNLMFMVDGFDILHNLTNVFYNVNAQARTETYTNVLPRYVMFHVQWRFHKAPKKK